MSTQCPKCHSENPDNQKFCGECATPLPQKDEVMPTKTIETPIEELTTGSTFAGRYQIIEELGKGGMGSVYKVLDKETNEKIALKLIKPEIASDKKTIERFRNELTYARKIVQKNVCRMYDLNKEKNSYYITMEYVSGGDLKKFIRRSEQLSVGKAISIAKQICDGLEEAHSLGIVHRDLKPNNIMIDDHGNARIMDFGIARTVKEKGITGSGVMIGTPEYMSPEQVEAKEVDRRSDIYSLGIILYEMLTGKLPFEADTPLAIGVKQKSEIPKSPKEYNSQISDDLNLIILKCLEKDKNNRYQDAGEFRSELEKIEQGLPTTDRIIPKRKTLTSKEITVQLKIRKLLIPAFLIIAVVILGLLLWKPWAPKGSIPESTEKLSIAILPFKDLSLQKDQQPLCEGLAESLIIALGKIPELRVPARTSSFFFKSEDRNLKEVGERLNVQIVFEASLQKLGDKIRIMAKLIRISDETIIWSETYNQEMEDLFSLQDAITIRIAEELKLRLVGSEREMLKKRYTENLEAYKLYVQGRFFWNRRTEEDLKKAIDYFQQAIEKDPKYALAYAGVAEAYAVLPYYSSFSGREAYTKVMQFGQKAVEIDNELAEAHAAIAFVKLYDWDFKGADLKFRQAIKLNPKYPTGYQWHAINLIYMNKFDEAIIEIEPALQLDPVSFIINWDASWVYFMARRYDKALEMVKKAQELAPNQRRFHYRSGQIFLYKNMYQNALAEFELDKEQNGDNLNLKLFKGITYMKMGKVEEGRELFDELSEKVSEENVSHAFKANFYVALGDFDRVYLWLDRLYEERDFRFLGLIQEPQFDVIRTDPRYLGLMKKMGLD